MRPRRPAVAMVALAAALAAVSIAAGAAADSPLPHRPAIRFADGVPGDLRDLATATWGRFLHAFPARWECLDDVTLRGAWRFGSRGAYDPNHRLVTVRIPGTAPNLAATMVHEFAHHLEYSCPEQRDVRARFLASQGFPPGTPWRRGDTWADVPSEQFAQAVIQVVLGPDPDPLILVHPSTVRLIRRWGRGG